MPLASASLDWHSLDGTVSPTDTRHPERCMLSLSLFLSDINRSCERSLCLMDLETRKVILVFGSSS